ncbi:hypothetical protein T265_00625 [Opisthorchis viverrini]|uniref:Uncharacterized protein n=1 Tax=Opisthorchis viverrini TaxID=6198 RepID=A0A075ACA0_OPIVI|nr:hypothetical protein T265_00625 [Opisthorchis viverrini]KER33510.1 hypothetical protein T265_00625 [Opisthorchis viverrini]
MGPRHPTRIVLFWLRTCIANIQYKQVLLGGFWARWPEWLDREFTDRKVRGLGNLAVSQPSCFLRVAWRLGTGRVLQLNAFFGGGILSSRCNQAKMIIKTSPIYNNLRTNRLVSPQMH